jgi:hypothetical protein
MRTPKFGLLLPRSTPATLVVADVRGAVVACRNLSGSGPQRVSFDFRHMSPGLYFVSVTQGSRPITRRLCVVH